MISQTSTSPMIGEHDNSYRQTSHLQSPIHQCVMRLFADYAQYCACIKLCFMPQTCIVQYFQHCLVNNTPLYFCRHCMVLRLNPIISYATVILYYIVLWPFILIKNIQFQFCKYLCSIVFVLCCIFCYVQTCVKFYFVIYFRQQQSVLFCKYH